MPRRPTKDAEDDGLGPLSGDEGDIENLGKIDPNDPRFPPPAGDDDDDDDVTDPDGEDEDPEED